MPIEANLLSSQSPATAYARLLREMHRLIRDGDGDSDEAETLADQMDVFWHGMTEQEQSRLRGLASDLHALRDGGPKRVAMAREQLASWRVDLSQAMNRAETGDADSALVFLRQPVPFYLPRQIIPSMQARCWEKLGDLETALEFMKVAERFEPDQALRATKNSSRPAN